MSSWTGYSSVYLTPTGEMPSWTRQNHCSRDVHRPVSLKRRSSGWKQYREVSDPILSKLFWKNTRNWKLPTSFLKGHRKKQWPGSVRPCMGPELHSPKDGPAMTFLVNLSRFLLRSQSSFLGKVRFHLTDQIYNQQRQAIPRKRFAVNCINRFKGTPYNIRQLTTILNDLVLKIMNFKRFM